MRQITIALQGKMNHVYQFTFDARTPTVEEITKNFQDLIKGDISSLCISDHEKKDGYFDVVFTQEIVKECIVGITEKFIR